MSLIIQRLKNCLDQNKVHYHVVHHRPDYSAQQTAADTQTQVHQFLKAVVLEIGDIKAYIMMVVPADMHVDLLKLADLFSVSKARIVSEHELKKLFPDSEVGAQAPLGNLYGMTVYIDPSLDDNDIVTFNAGSHDTAIRVRWADYARLVKPVPLPVGAK
jgi:Ala-tRNA(Pro) deacylase